MITGQLKSQTNKIRAAVRICCVAKPGRQHGAIPQLHRISLQRRSAIIMESLERQKARQRAHLAELVALFACLQHRAFRGER
jgi:hypothetical protein